MRRGALDDSDQGRCISATASATSRATSRAFRALVYNKGAAVLHMLRRLVGDEAFFRGLRRFYAGSRFQKAGTDDFRRAMEAESGRSLDRFFERWIYGSDAAAARRSAIASTARATVARCTSSRLASLRPAGDRHAAATPTGQPVDVVVPRHRPDVVERAHPRSSRHALRSVADQTSDDGDTRRDRRTSIREPWRSDASRAGDCSRVIREHQEPWPIEPGPRT